MAEAVPSPARICWLASYPRSGNTWVRFLLTAYFLGKVESGVEVANAVPDLHMNGAEVGALSGVAFVKTHFMWGPRHPFRERTGRVILLIRHPRDVLLSCIGLHRAVGSRGSDAAPLVEGDYAREFIEHGGDREWLERGFGTWSTHARSWQDQREFPVLTVKYEDLRRDTAGQLTRILEFGGHPVRPGRVAASVGACSLETMRKLEEEDKGAGKRGAFSGSKQTLDQGHAFIAHGRVGESLETICPGLDNDFEARFGTDVRRVGYDR